MAQWKRAGPITQRSVDRNYLLLTVAFCCAVNPFLTNTKRDIIEKLISIYGDCNQPICKTVLKNAQNKCLDDKLKLGNTAKQDGAQKNAGNMPDVTRN